MKTGVMIYAQHPGYLEVTKLAIKRLRLNQAASFLIDYSDLFRQISHQGITGISRRDRENSRRNWESLGFRVLNAREFNWAEPHPVWNPSVVQNISKTVDVEISADFRLLRQTNLWPSVRNFRKLELANGLESYALTLSLIRCLELEQLVVLNGRYPVQRGAELAATESGIRLMFLERPRFGGNGCFLRPYPTRDSSSLYQDGIAESENVSLDNLTASAEGWLSSRAGMIPGPAISQESVDCSVAFFTSSSNELIIAEEEAGLSFQPQFELFSKALERLGDSLDTSSVVIRLHPSLQDKSPAEYFSQLLSATKIKVRHRALVIDSFDSTSSYSLLGRSGLVVVSHSTIGIEALVAGREVVALWPTPFILEAGIGHLDLNADPMILPPVNRERTIRIVAGNIILDSRGVDENQSRDEIGTPKTVNPSRNRLFPIRHIARLFLAFFSGIFFSSRDTVWAIRQANKIVNLLMTGIFRLIWWLTTLRPGRSEVR